MGVISPPLKVNCTKSPECVMQYITILKSVDSVVEQISKLILFFPVIQVAFYPVFLLPR